MNPSTIGRLAGWMALERTDGEPLLFRGGTLTAVVDRTPQRPLDRDRVDLDPQDLNLVEARKTLFPEGMPQDGESFEDADGVFLRVQGVPRITDLTYRCECSPSRETGS